MTTREFEGVSAGGQLQEALEDAIRQAGAEALKSSTYFSWELVSISGDKGGTVGSNKVEVKIKMHLPSGNR